MRKIYTIVFLALASCGFAQLNEPQPTLPNIVPPAPSVAALMKLEEIPVDYYSGTPNIALPLYAIPLKQGISLDLSLSYSTTGVKIDEIPSWIGTGWSLNCGGSVSRTMIGVADDDLKGVFNNGYYNYPNMSSEDKEIFLWNAKRFSRDTEPDLFQYSFMGKSGRFYLKKNPVTGQIEPVDLNADVEHKIEVEIQPAAPYKIISFTITDESGIKYFFSNKDITVSIPQPQAMEPYDQYTSAWHLTTVKSANNELLCEFQYQAATETYRTPTSYSYASPLFALSNPDPILCGGMIPLLPSASSSFSSISVSSSVLKDIIVPGKGKASFVIGARTQPLTNPNGNYNGYKLATVIIKDNADIEVKRFNFTNPVAGESGRIFLDMVEEIVPNTTKKNTYVFGYTSKNTLPKFGSRSKDYWGYFNNKANTTLSPLLGGERNVSLSAIKTGVLESITYPTGGVRVFEFESNTYSYIGNRLLNPSSYEDIPENLVSVFKSWNISSSKVPLNNMMVYFDGPQTIDVLFRANSFNASTRQDIQGYELKITPMSPNFPIDPNGAIQEFDPGAFSPITDYNNPVRNIKIEDCGSVMSISECSKPILLEGWYNFQLIQGNYLASHPVTYGVSFNYKKMGNSFKYTYGGGLRIKKLKLVDNGETVSDLLFDYQKSDNPTLSSGSQGMKAKKPFYVKRRDVFVPGSGGLEVQCWFFDHELLYKMYDDQSGLEIPLDKGGYVGYKNVSVKNVSHSYETVITPENPLGELVEVNTPVNGRKDFVYLSGIDFPNATEELYYPYPKVVSYEYKRGLLIESRIFNQANQKLTEELNTYSFTDNITTIGFSLKEHEIYDCPLNGVHNNYTGFKSSIIDALDELYNNNGAQTWTNWFNTVTSFPARGWFTCNKAERYLYILPNNYMAGWARLSETISKNYLYDTPASSPRIVSQKTTYDYNTLNKQPKEIVSEGTNLVQTKTKIFYPDDVTSVSSLSGEALTSAELGAIQSLNKNNQHRISEPVQTEAYRNNELVSVQRTISKDWGNNLISVAIIKASKGSGNLENRIRYSAIDNSNGNPLEIQQENGTKICYIWGYNKTQPVAKIENINYSSIPANLITAVQDASNSTAANAEDLLLGALENLRASTALAGAQISTYSYKPLVGVSTITDAKGDRIRYEYDAFGRLKAVRDSDNNILTENEYHYRTQN